MQGLVNRAIQCFVRDNYGWAVWEQVVRTAGVGVTSFEAMLDYDPAISDRLCLALAEVLRKPRDALLEDLGTYLVSHPTTEPLRRLLRFGGTGFADFLMSLDDLPDKARFAMPDIRLPAMSCREVGDMQFELRIAPGLPGFGAVMLGVLRAMADDYGALALLERDAGNRCDRITVTLADAGFTQGKGFALAAGGDHDPAR